MSRRSSVPWPDHLLPDPRSRRAAAAASAPRAARRGRRWRPATRRTGRPWQVHRGAGIGRRDRPPRLPPACRDCFASAPVPKPPAAAGRRTWGFRATARGSLTVAESGESPATLRRIPMNRAVRGGTCGGSPRAPQTRRQPGVRDRVPLRVFSARRHPGMPHGGTARRSLRRGPAGCLRGAVATAHRHPRDS